MDSETTWGGARANAGRPRKYPLGETRASMTKKCEFSVLYKVCTMCGIDKRRDDFSFKSGTFLKSNCKACVAKRSRDYYKHNKEKCKQAVAIWNKENPTKSKNCRLNWAAKNKDHIAQYAKLRSDLQATKDRAKPTYQRQVAMVSDGYAASLLGMHLNDCPPELIQLKREHLLTKRAVHEFMQTLEKQNGN